MVVRLCAVRFDVIVEEGLVYLYDDGDRLERWEDSEN
jgi:hypothetical protein